MSQCSISNQLQSLFDEYKSCTYALSVDNVFVDQFLLDRTTISAAAREYWLQDPNVSKLLVTENGGSWRHRLQFGTHRFGLSTVEENFALSRIIKELRPRRLLEIGIFRGQTATTVCRAMQESGIDGVLTAVDIDPAAVAVAERVLDNLALKKYANLVKGESLATLTSLKEIDFAFIDGDHSFDMAAAEFVESYNKLAPGGMIAMHDTGSPSWGYYQGPGLLFFLVLPELLQGKAVQSWLDSMCREFTMQMLSPYCKTKYKYCENQQEGLELATLTQADIIAGAGGMGFVLKLSETHQLDLNDILARKPKSVTMPLQVSNRRSLLGRIARRVANWIP